MHIVALSGSLRKKSFNTGLLRAAVSLVPSDVQLDVRTLDDFPLYNGDVEEAEGIPAAVTELKDAIAGADGLLLASPEYNNSIPGVAKNAIDWLTRPTADIPRVFHGKPLAVIGATPGGFGTILGQNAWLPVFRYLGTRHWNEGRLLVSRVNTLFDDAGNLTDDKTREQLQKFLAGFVDFIRQGTGD